MILLSLIIHLIVITLILISIPTTSKHVTFGTAYTVQLVGSEAVLRANDSSFLKDMLQSKESESSIIIKRKITSVYSSLLKKKSTDRLDIEKAVSAIRQKEQARSKATPITSASGKSKISDAEINELTNNYIDTIWSKVKRNWTMPQALMPGKKITTIIDVRISRNGALEYVNYEKRSGNRFFDDSALRAVKKASPFPPLPNWIKDDSIEIGIRFHSEELR